MQVSSRLPFQPIPSGEISEDFGGGRLLVIRPLAVSLVDRFGGRSYLETDRSNVALSRLREAAQNGEEVTYIAQDGAVADPSSVAALNCYLRTARAMRRMKLPFDRLSRSGNHRYAWADFCKYLGLQFQ